LDVYTLRFFQRTHARETRTKVTFVRNRYAYVERPSGVYFFHTSRANLVHGLIRHLNPILAQIAKVPALRDSCNRWYEPIRRVV